MEIFSTFTVKLLGKLRRFVLGHTDIKLGVTLLLTKNELRKDMPGVELLGGELGWQCPEQTNRG